MWTNASDSCIGFLSMGTTPKMALTLSSLVTSSGTTLAVLVMIMIDIRYTFLVVSSARTPPSRLVPPFRLVSVFALTISPSI